MRCLDYVGQCDEVGLGSNKNFILAYSDTFQRSMIGSNPVDTAGHTDDRMGQQDCKDASLSSTIYPSKLRFDARTP